MTLFERLVEKISIALDARKMRKKFQKLTQEDFNRGWSSGISKALRKYNRGECK
jgi:hypothetical protein